MKLEKWLDENIDKLYENSMKNEKKNEIIFKHYLLNLHEDAVDQSKTTCKKEYTDAIKKTKLKQMLYIQGEQLLH